MESSQKRRSRQRPTRVDIVYDVETGGATVKKELPFIMGVLADLAGDGADDLPELEKRKFIEIGPENFDKVLKSQGAKLAFTVDDKLSGEENSKLGVELKFEEFEDFSPERVAEQVPAVAALLEKRKQLSDLRGRLASNRKLDKKLQATLAEAVENDDTKSALEAQVAEATASDDEGGDDGES